MRFMNISSEPTDNECLLNKNQIVYFYYSHKFLFFCYFFTPTRVVVVVL